jgi:hypothetical protein
MWGPYDRTAYDRGGSAGAIYNQLLSAAYELTGSLATTLVYLLTLSATYVLKGYRLRLRPGKLLRATYIMRGGMVRSIGKKLTAAVVYTGDISMQRLFHRTLSATYMLTGKITKRMYVNLLATTVWVASRFRLQRVYGWDYSGIFAPGDRIKVDRDRLTVTLNGSNVMHLVDGDLPFFAPGPNALTYEDSEGTRQVRIRVSWRGRWL